MAKYRVILRDDSGPRVQEVVTIVESDESLSQLAAHAHIRTVIELLPADSKEKPGVKLTLQEYDKQKADEQEAREQEARNASTKAEREALKAEVKEELKKEAKK